MVSVAATVAPIASGRVKPIPSPGAPIDGFLNGRMQEGAPLATKIETSRTNASMDTADWVFILVDFEIAASSERVWRLIGDFANGGFIGRGFITHMTANGNHVGATRTLHLLKETGGGEVIERQAARDEQGMYYSYVLDDPGPLPIDDYFGSVHVVPVGADTSRVTWTNRYRVRDVAVVDAMRAQSRSILELIEANTREALGLHAKGATA